MKTEINMEDALKELAASSPLVVGNEITKRLEGWYPDQVPSIVLCAYIAQAIGENIVSIPFANIRNICATMERLLCDGTNEVKDAMTMGMLESFIGQSAASKLDFSLIAPHLGTESRKYCEAWDAFNGARTTGLYE